MRRKWRYSLPYWPKVNSIERSDYITLKIFFRGGPGVEHINTLGHSPTLFNEVKFTVELRKEEDCESSSLAMLLEAQLGHLRSPVGSKWCGEHNNLSPQQRTWSPCTPGEDLLWRCHALQESDPSFWLCSLRLFLCVNMQLSFVSTACLMIRASVGVGSYRRWARSWLRDRVGKEELKISARALRRFEPSRPFCSTSGNLDEKRKPEKYFDYHKD
jgi:hypothetical protein